MTLRCRVVSRVSRSAIKPAAPPAPTASFQSHLVAVLSADSVENDVLVQIPHPLPFPLPIDMVGLSPMAFFPDSRHPRTLVGPFLFPFPQCALVVVCLCTCKSCALGIIPVLCPPRKQIRLVSCGRVAGIIPCRVSRGECICYAWWWPCSSPPMSIHWVWSLSVAVATPSVSWLVNAQPQGSRHPGGLSPSSSAPHCRHPRPDTARWRTGPW